MDTESDQDTDRARRVWRRHGPVRCLNQVHIENCCKITKQYTSVKSLNNGNYPDGCGINP